MTSCTTTQTCWPTHKTKSNDNNTHTQHLVLYERRAVIAPDIAKQQDNIQDGYKSRPTLPFQTTIF